jgi:hypothetical protein
MRYGVFILIYSCEMLLTLVLLTRTFVCRQVLSHPG